MIESKIIGYGMTKSEKDKEDIEMLFSERAEYKKARRREYYLAHREEELAYSRVWRAGNSERYRERNRLYREKNKERLKEQAREYRRLRRASSSSVDVCASSPSAGSAGP